MADTVCQIRSSGDSPDTVWHIPDAAWNFRTLSRKFSLEELRDLARAFPLPWSHYVLLISRSRSPEAFAICHSEALRGGWFLRQLHRQIDSQFYERTALSRHKAAMLALRELCALIDRVPFNLSNN